MGDACGAAAAHVSQLVSRSLPLRIRQVSLRLERQLIPGGAFYESRKSDAVLAESEQTLVVEGETLSRRSQFIREYFDDRKLIALARGKGLQATTIFVSVTRTIPMRSGTILSRRTVQIDQRVHRLLARGESSRLNTRGR